jgi:type VI secretion system lysozyme-like protein
MALFEKFLHKKKEESIINAIVRNLNQILNSKKSFSSYLPQFGIGDWNQHKARHKIIETILEEIKENIELYEPRVKLLEIHEVDSEVAHRLRFEMKCIILNKDKPIYVIFDSILNDIIVENL